MRIIGLTGGIGTGKSTVSDYLKKKGYTIIDADKLAREIVLPGSQVLQRLVQAFGEEILLPGGELNRKLLGSMVFGNPEKKALLDKITHGEICGRIEAAVKGFSGEALVIDAPLLFETGLSRLATEVWVVDAEDEIRIERVRRRDGMSREETERRIAAQLSREEKWKRADRLLDNSGTVEELYRRIDEIIMA